MIACPALSAYGGDVLLEYDLILQLRSAWQLEAMLVAIPLAVLGMLLWRPVLDWAVRFVARRWPDLKTGLGRKRR